MRGGIGCGRGRWCRCSRRSGSGRRRPVWRRPGGARPGVARASRGLGSGRDRPAPAPRRSASMGRRRRRRRVVTRTSSISKPSPASAARWRIASTETVREGALALVIGGDHAISIGSIPGARAAIGPEARLGVIWLDSHADLNNAETTPSGQYPRHAARHRARSGAAPGLRDGGPARPGFARRM